MRPSVLEPLKLVEGRPARHEVGVGDEHARRVLVGAKSAHRLARLDEQRLVVFERAELAHDDVERLPRARRAARPAVDDEIIGALGHLGVEVVVEHPERRLLDPSFAGELGPPRRSYHPAALRHALSLPRDDSTSTARNSSPACPMQGL